jgi:ribonuclease HI
MKTQSIKIKIYTDGACSGNPGPGGWAAIIIDENGKETILRGGEKNTTNNRMELTALINALVFVRASFMVVPDIRATTRVAPTITIYSDSKYVIDGTSTWMPNWIKRGWKGSDKKPVKNRDLWEKINELKQEIDFEFVWVKGHNEDKYNEMADMIAVEESKKF